MCGLQYFSIRSKKWSESRSGEEEGLLAYGVAGLGSFGVKERGICRGGDGGGKGCGGPDFNLNLGVVDLVVPGPTGEMSYWGVDVRTGFVF